jgi:hypothetical protein
MEAMSDVLCVESAPCISWSVPRDRLCLGRGCSDDEDDGEPHPIDSFADAMQKLGGLIRFKKADRRLAYSG